MKRYQKNKVGAFTLIELLVVIAIIGILIGLFILELAIVAIIPGFTAPEQRLERKKQTLKHSFVKLTANSEKSEN